MRLFKMHGIGNDYVYADCMNETVGDPGALAVRISDRHFGVGGDGLIMICPSKIADCRMRMYNQDGSEGGMCGNGIRCVGKFMYDSGYVTKPHLTVETKSGLRELDLVVEDGICTGATVDMGRPVIEEKELTVRAGKMKAVCVDVGNPRCIFFVDDADGTDPAVLGPVVENLAEFPDRTNVEFVTVYDKNNMRMRVWERGSGITLACGTGATASAAAAAYLGLCERNVNVKLDGGTLNIRWDTETDHLFMTGSATYVFDIKNYDISGCANIQSAKEK